MLGAPSWYVIFGASMAPLYLAPLGVGGGGRGGYPGGIGYRVYKKKKNMYVFIYYIHTPTHSPYEPHIACLSHVIALSCMMYHLVYT